MHPAPLLGIALGLWAGAWCAYYAVQETVRHAALRQRRARFPLRPPAPHGAWDGRADAAERTAIVARFGALRFFGRFLNVTPEWREQGLWEWLYWKLVHSVLLTPRIGWDGGVRRDMATAEGRRRFDELLPVHALDHARLWAPHELSFTWLGQSTCLVRIGGLTVLTDPVFADKPLESVLSPTRMRPMPCTLDEVAPHVDAVLVSHNHFDHLDLGVLPHLAHAHWIVPTGTRHLFRGLPRVHELGWWADLDVDIDTRILSVAGVPASHWSARTPLDTNTSLWNSYAVRVGHSSLFFCGDSGYSDSLFTAIGRVHGPFDAAAIPIGSYEPRWHLAMQHMDPHGAVRAARRLGTRRAFGMHWGTWCMSDERWDAPPHDLALALAAEGEPPEFFSTVPLGYTTYLVV